ncbi:MAG: aminotransferase class I/II-fold pyridoxal phosphate-dependent enzyme [Myxococcota bacterium]
MSHGFSTRSVHVHGTELDVETEAIAPPIVQTSSFGFESMESMDRVIGHSKRGYAYSRLTNPTVDLFERATAELEGAEEGVAFASGMAAIHGVMTTLLSAGDHIVAPHSVYGGSHALFTQMLPRFNVETSFAQTGDLTAMEAAITSRTKILYIESITNPTLEVADLAGASALAKRHDLTLVVDSTLATPALIRPIEHGAEVVIHSASKYLGGHGDLIAGVAVGPKALMRPLRKSLLLAGGNCAPFVAWLVLRGIKTLDLRMEKHCRNALAVARHLAEHPQVRTVRYPTLDVPEQVHSELGGRGGAMVSFVLEGGDERACRALNALRLFKRAGSLGDAHSLALIPSLASHRSFSPEERLDAGIPEGFVRLSIGLEDEADLLGDLDRALSASL